jgi:AraC-like DNA-binding protein
VEHVRVYWVVRGTGYIRLKQQDCILRAGDVVLYGPDAQSLLWTEDDDLEYRFLTIDGLGASAIVEGLGLPREPLQVGPCPADTFHSLADTLKQGGLVNERRTSVAVYDVLADLSIMCSQARDEESIPHDAKAKDLADRAAQEMEIHLSDASTGVAQIANVLGVDRFELSRTFKSAFGIPPKEYFSQLRLQRALDLLRSTDMSISAISNSAGFGSANYMAKLVRSKMGCSPSQLRSVEF